VYISYAEWFRKEDLTLSILIYIYIYVCVCVCEAPGKAKNFNVLYIYIYGPMFSNAEIHLLHNVSTLNQCRVVSYVTVVCKHFASQLSVISLESILCSSVLHLVNGMECRAIKLWYFSNRQLGNVVR
jgi:hypothetical protein